MISIAVVEDNEFDRKNLIELLERYKQEKGVEINVTCFSDAVDFVTDYKYCYDLIFMDVMMPYLGGINAAKKIRQVDESVAIVFVSNMAQFAIDGYDVNALFYLLKPLSYASFSTKLDKILISIEQTHKEFLLLEPPFEKRRICTKEIKYIEVFLHDVVFHLFNEDIHVHGSLVKYEKLLNPEKFCRISSCYIVNLAHVTAVKEMSAFIGDIELKISNTRKRSLMKALARYVAGVD